MYNKKNIDVLLNKMSNLGLVEFLQLREKVEELDFSLTLVASKMFEPGLHCIDKSWLHNFLLYKHGESVVTDNIFLEDMLEVV